MKPVSRALGQVLLDHHNTTTQQHPLGKRLNVKRYTLSYGVLCQLAGVPPILREMSASTFRTLPNGAMTKGGHRLMRWP
jgi:hypothetical protein